MSAKITQLLPEADIIGNLRDQPGILIRVNCTALNAINLERLGHVLRQCGASGWNWVAEDNSIKIRVYRSRTSYLFAPSNWRLVLAYWLA